MIVNFPGSKKAVVECFQAISNILPHAIELIVDEKLKTAVTHKELQKDFKMPEEIARPPKLPVVSSSKIDLDSSEFSEFSDITDLLNQSASGMDEVSHFPIH